MAPTTDDLQRQLRRSRRIRRIAVATILILLLVAGAAYAAATSDLFPRVPPGWVGVLIRRHGRPLPAGAALAPKVAPGELPFQGIREDVLLPGWYPFAYSALDWDWEILPQTVIPPGHVGVLVRLFGEDLPDGQLFADENPADLTVGIVRRGPLLKTIEPGIHPINLRAYDVRVFPVRTIEPGQVGVVCRRYGRIPTDRSAFLSQDGERGVQAHFLPPGTYYVNPLAEEVRAVWIRSRRLDLGSAGRVKFHSSDGFEITVSGTVEWSLDPAQMPLVYCKYGDAMAVEQRLLLPAARTKSGLQGSRKPAREFISGSTRQTFQEEFARELRAVVEPEGMKLHSVLVNGIVPADEIAKPIRDREIAMLQREEYQQQMDTEKTKSQLTKETELGKRPAALAKAQSRTSDITTQARRALEVELIQASSAVEVARLERDSAQRQSESILAEGAATAHLAQLRAASAGEALRRRVAAHGGGEALAHAALLEKLAPKITSIWTNTDGPIASIFGRFTSNAPTSRPAGTIARAEVEK